MSFRANSLRIAAAFLAVAILGVAPAAFAQQESGNLFGQTSDEQGARLPGVSVTLTGYGAPLTATTDSRGEFRFLNLAPGNWTVTCELQGFAKVTKTDIQVAVGKNTNVVVTMKLSTVEAAVTVKGEAALIDTRKVATGATVNQVELTSIPTARDPWVILQSVPGVQIDRLNNGGDQSGQQSFYVGKGAMEANNVWNLDGVNVTDMSATGSSAFYYDFDSFEEISATTGGADITQMTPGVQLNLVTKRGTNDIHGSARAFWTPNQWQSQNTPPAVAAQPPPNNQGTQIDEIQDYGVEVGGPLWQDKAWLWGAYGRNQVNLIQIGGASDKTTLIDVNGKVNLQPIESTGIVLAYTQNEKDKFGRGVGVTHPPDTAYNQGGFDGKPTANMKVELSQVVSSSLFLTANYSYVRGGFQLVPEAGLGVNNTYLDSNGVWHNSYIGFLIQRPLHNVGATGSYFFNAGPVGNELKFGFAYRTGKANTTSIWPGDGNWMCQNCFGTGQNVAIMTREGNARAYANWYNGYLGDVLTMGNLTANIGVRYDVQEGNNGGGAVAANPIIPDILPALGSSTGPQQFSWKDWQPRVGLTYAVGDAKKLLLKASYARFVDQMGYGNITVTNPSALAGIEFYTTTQPGVPITRNSLDFNTGVPCGAVNCQGFYGFNPANPTSPSSPNFIQQGLKAGKTDEFLVGADYEIMPDLVAGLAYTHRKYFDQSTNFPSAADGTVYTPANWSNLGGISVVNNGATFTIPAVFGLNTTVPAGVTEVNRPNYDQTYDGVELTFQKRLSNNWMMRGNFTWAANNQSGPLTSCANPNNVVNGATGGSCPGNDIMVQGPGLGSGAFQYVYLNAKWNFNISGVYQLPWNFNVGANFYGREGYPRLSYISTNAGDGLGGQNILVGKIGSERYPDVFNFDLRIEKVLPLKPLQVALSLDVFNVANGNTVLQQQSLAGKASYNTTTGVWTTSPVASYGTITEIQAPRTVRAGARISF
jgi:hypothetical protein